MTLEANRTLTHQRILIIEKEREIADKVRDALEAGGNHVEIALSPEVGVAIIEQRHMDVVVFDSDQTLPETIDTIEEMRELQPQLPVIVILPKEKKPKRHKVLRRITVGILEKPLDYATLLKEIDKIWKD